MTIESSRQLLTAKDRIADRAERAFKEAVSKDLPTQFNVMVFIHSSNPTQNASQGGKEIQDYGFCRARSQAGHHDMLRDPAGIGNVKEREAVIQSHFQAYYSLSDDETIPQNGDIWSASQEGAVVRLISLVERKDGFSFPSDTSDGGEAKTAFKSTTKKRVDELVEQGYTPPLEKEYVGKEVRLRGTIVQNGAIPQELLKTATKGYAGARPTLIKDVIDSYDSLCEAFAKEFTGFQLGAHSSIRTYEKQVELKKYWTDRGSPGRAANPGRSKHGWGLAFDASYYRNGSSKKLSLTFDSKQFKWLSANIGRFGFIHPWWAREGQENDEPWHFEWGKPKEVIK